MTLNRKLSGGWQVFANRCIFSNCAMCVPNLQGNFTVKILRRRVSRAKKD